ncbi:cytochrome C oxidase subunit II [bacterium]|nr:MAG: cytochrome C oxidase subunit II [bacterium]
MVDSSTVLMGQTAAYTLYVLAIMALMWWFARRVTQQGKSPDVKPGLFYTWVGFLIILGVSLHLVTYFTIPWKPVDMNRAEIQADKEFAITIASHKFALPAEKLEVSCNEMVRFNVTSADLTYGFGVFREDLSMVFQMQVIPGHNNDILWQFTRPGIYTIASKEYSGPAGINMILPGAIVVTDNRQTNL